MFSFNRLWVLRLGPGLFPLCIAPLQTRPIMIGIKVMHLGFSGKILFVFSCKLHPHNLQEAERGYLG